MSSKKKFTLGLVLIGVGLGIASIGVALVASVFIEIPSAN